MHAATKAKERAARFRPAVLGTVLLLFGAAWTWLIQGGASPGAINSPALQALCGDWADGAAAGNQSERSSNDTREGSTSSGSSGDDAAGPSGMRHIYVVGCGHSGTSLLKRTIGNLPGLDCRPKETWLYEHLGGKPDTLKQRLLLWDKQAAERNFTGWVEKTPRHINYLDRIFRLDTKARVVLVVRDGRDVAASLKQRGSPWADCMGRWVKDNSAALPFLDHPRLLTVKFEEFFDPAHVLGVLRQLAEFVGMPATGVERMLLALQPPTALLTADEQCVAYDNEEQKLDDLSSSYLQHLAASSMVGSNSGGSKGREPDPRDHKRRRSWQSSQPWGPQRSVWKERLSTEEQGDIAANGEMQALLRRFGYIA
ncbi:hypothetical protein ABPG77_000687 [Micractinium sp. CCAP 211/92]